MGVEILQHGSSGLQMSLRIPLFEGKKTKQVILTFLRIFASLVTNNSDKESQCFLLSL